MIRLDFGLLEKSRLVILRGERSFRCGLSGRGQGECAFCTGYIEEFKRTELALHVYVGEEVEIGSAEPAEKVASLGGICSGVEGKRHIFLVPIVQSFTRHIGQAHLEEGFDFHFSIVCLYEGNLQWQRQHPAGLHFPSNERHCAG